VVICSALQLGLEGLTGSAESTSLCATNRKERFWRGKSFRAVDAVTKRLPGPRFDPSEEVGGGMIPGALIERRARSSSSPLSPASPKPMLFPGRRSTAWRRLSTGLPFDMPCRQLIESYAAKRSKQDGQRLGRTLPTPIITWPSRTPPLFPEAVAKHNWKRVHICVPLPRKHDQCDSSGSP
jgi:hypothetical protein